MPDAPPPFRMPGEKTSEQQRPNAHQRGYTRQWAKSATRFRQQNQWCEWCDELGFAAYSQHTDHIIPHRNERVPLLFQRELRLDPENRQALCESCHAKKTLGEGRGQILFVAAPRREYIIALNQRIGSPFEICETVRGTES